MKKLFIELGFTQLQSDTAVFIKDAGTDYMVVAAVYVDNILLVGPSRTAIKTAKKGLKRGYQMNDLGPLTTFLGTQVSKISPTGDIHLSQSGYINKILDIFGLEDSSPRDTSMESKLRLTKAKAGEESSNELRERYQAVVGSLVWASTQTRPDIAYSVSVLGQFAANPTKSHYTGTKHVLQYLHDSSEHEITYKTSDEPLKLIYYVDSDWAGDVDTRKFITGYVLTLAKGAVCWSSKRQNTIALSSTEAEYITISSAIREIIFLPRLLDKLKLPQVKQYTTSSQQLKLKSIIIYNDNKEALQLTEETAVHPRTKHIEV